MPIKSNLHKAKRQKNDDFYTQLSDIENELKHYKPHFAGKVVYCNCDDPTASNFYHYFSMNFHFLGLKKLITTCYQNPQHDIFSNYDSEKSIWLECGEGTSEKGAYVPSKPLIRHLAGDGDFRSSECVELLKQADIVVTNPPFSLFREYIAQLIEYEKKFLVLGNQNSISNKEIFPLIKNRKMWLGMDNGGTKWFEVKPHYEIETEARKRIENGKKYFSMGNIAWFTNLDHSKRHQEIILTQRYSPEKYQKYDNYDAIEVNKYTDIPMDYDGEMGVPVTFIDKHNPKQFEIVGMDRPLITGRTGKQSRFKIEGKEVYARIVIRNRRLRS